MFAIDPSAGTAQITVTLDDPRGIAAAAVGGGQRDNTNLAALATLRTTGDYESKRGRHDHRPTPRRWRSASRWPTRRQTIHDNAVASREALSGVDLDTEAVDLMRFQQAYAATSRVIQVARETIQTILDIR